jgi:hypothetical protein
MFFMFTGEVLPPPAMAAAAPAFFSGRPIRSLTALSNLSRAY